MDPQSFSRIIDDSFRKLSLDEIMDERTQMKLSSEVPDNLKNLVSIKDFENLTKNFLKAVLPKHHQTIEKFLQDVINTKQIVEKNSAKSKAFRQEGNKMYKATNWMDNFIEVFRIYNKSIAYAPKKSEEMALSYANRAMVFFRLKYFNESLDDINRALSSNYPAKTTGKLLVKKIRCMKIVNHPDLHVNYNDSLKWVDENAENDQQLKIDLKNAYEQEAEPCSPSINTQFRDVLLEEMQKSCPDLKKIKIGRNNVGDLALFATTDIHVGEVVAVQKMYTQIYRIQKPYIGCWQCLVMCLNPVPCDYCTIAMYCSESCKAEAWNKNHESECNLMFLLQNFMGHYLLPIRISMYAMKQLGGILPLMKEVLKMSKTEDMKEEHRIVDGKYPSDLYRNVYYMSNQNPIPVHVRYFDVVLDICMFVYYIATRTTLFNKKYQGEMFTVMEEREPKFFASLILRHYVMLMHMQLNGYYLANDICMVSTPVCPLFYLIRHSCNPNTSKIVLNDHQVVVAIDEIKKGQIINLSYSNIALVEFPEAERAKFVLKSMCVPCKCEICMVHRPNVVLPFQRLERSPEKLRMIENTLSKVMKTIDKHENETEPKTAEEFLRQMSELYRSLRAFFAVAPPLCEEVISQKNLLLKIFTFELNNKIYNFSKFKKRSDSGDH